MTIPTDKILHLPRDRREWLIFIAIYAAAGAVLGSAGRAPLSEEDASWPKWAALVVEWVVCGGLIGLMVHRLTGGVGSYRQAILSLAIAMPVLFFLVEIVRTLAAWYTGGWARNATSAAIGALVGIAVSPLLFLWFAAMIRILTLVLPSTPTGRAGDSGRPG